MNIDFTITTDAEITYHEVELVISATPKDYGRGKNILITSTVGSVLEMVVNFGNIPNRIITAVVVANGAQKDHVARMILEKLSGSRVGVCCFTMKVHSDNYCVSSIRGVIQCMKEAGKTSCSTSRPSQ